MKHAKPLFEAELRNPLLIRSDLCQSLDLALLAPLSPSP